MEIPSAIIYANQRFVGDQVSIELILHRGENDMELKRRLTRKEYKSYGNIQDLLPVTPKVGVKSTGTGCRVDTANIAFTHASSIDFATFFKPSITQSRSIDLPTQGKLSPPVFLPLTWAGIPSTLGNPVAATSYSEANSTDGCSGGVADSHNITRLEWTDTWQRRDFGGS